ncbi:MAG TPA: hypothetical protein VN803_06750 [Gemmatimonadales bacterium]|nr:hypothetical protein [Gemmatimonadales bacterium]
MKRPRPRPDPRPSTLPRLITLAAAARELNVTYGYLYGLVKDRLVNYIQLPGRCRTRTRIYFREADLHQLLDSHELQKRSCREWATPARSVTTASSASPKTLREECEAFDVEPDPLFMKTDGGDG